MCAVVATRRAYAPSASPTSPSPKDDIPSLITGYASPTASCPRSKTSNENLREALELFGPMIPAPLVTTFCSARGLTPVGGGNTDANPRALVGGRGGTLSHLRCALSSGSVPSYTARSQLFVQDIAL
jgi:hypothetical protein